jgi:hypothetical protein
MAGGDWNQTALKNLPLDRVKNRPPIHLDWFMNQTVKVSRGDVVGIGKVKIPRTVEFNYEIPMLAFLVINENQAGFIASCMHLQIDGYGHAEDAAVNDMIDNISGFLKANFSKLAIDDAWLNLKDLSHTDESTKELWNAYRDVQFDLAARGIPTDSVESLKKRISQLQFRVEQLESENAQLKEELSLIVDYTPVAA